jgi:hypothetical protein
MLRKHRQSGLTFYKVQCRCYFKSAFEELSIKEILKILAGTSCLLHTRCLNLREWDFHIGGYEKFSGLTYDAFRFMKILETFSSTNCLHYWYRHMHPDNYTVCTYRKSANIYRPRDVIFRRLAVFVHWRKLRRKWRSRH